MIEFEHVHKRYGAVVAVADISLTVTKGETLALVGANGAGKTTLMRLLLGLVRPTSGALRVAGHDTQRDGMAARQQIGYMPQRAVLYPNLTVAENLDFLARIRDVPRERVDAVQALLRLQDVARRPARELSGGMLQRLGLAQALLPDPPALVFDEPTVSLDPPSVATFKAVVNDLRAAGKTVLLASHNLADVQALADRIAILDRGLLIALDSIAGLAQRCALPERLGVELTTVSGGEVALAYQAGAQSANLRGRTLEITVALDRKVDVLRALIAGGAAISDFRGEPPALEAIYAQIIGRTQAEEHTPQSHKSHTASEQAVKCANDIGPGLADAAILYE